MKEIKISIAGASGITGIELLKILDRHEYSTIITVLSRTFEDKKISSVFQNTLNLNKNKNIFFKNFFSKSDIKDSDLIFLCLPPGKSMEYVKYLMENDYKGKIIDLGSDFRLKKPEVYEEWYKDRHILKDMLPRFVYGLPELNKKEIKNADYVANPGCYPTSVILALAPLLNLKYLEFDSITIDSKSGVSGAGRKLKDDYLFLNISENFFAYSPVKHRHIPEIEQELKNISESVNKISFTPHLLPINRGIFTSIYVGGTNIGEIIDAEDKIRAFYEDFYKNETFIKFINNDVPKISNVSGTNSAHIGFMADYRTSIIKIFSAIDNILKGASGQAVQNMNLMFGLDEEEGLNMLGNYN